MTKNLSYAAIWLAIGFLTSHLVHMFPILVGQILLPLHLVVLLAGRLSGPVVGGTTGMMLPLMTAVTLGRPPIQPPVALFMSAELFCYGLIMGLMRRQNVYKVLLLSWITGRVVFALSLLVIAPMLGFRMETFSSLMLSFAIGVPGVLVQLLLIPAVSKRVSLSETV